jgi:S-adenosyl methyltransferase
VASRFLICDSQSGYCARGASGVEATTPAHVRSRAAIRQLVDGMDIIEPGLAWPPEWRPDPGDEVPGNAAESYYCVVVARTS